MDLDHHRIRFSTYFKAIMVVTIIAMIAFFMLESSKVKHINQSMDAYMEDLKDQIFMSTYDHLKKGNMELFNRQMEEIGKYRGILEYSLLDAKGAVRYSSDPEKKNQIDSSVHGMPQHKTRIDGDQVTYYVPVFTVEYCTRCHPSWPSESINSYYKLTLSRKAATDINKLSLFYNAFIFLGGLLFLGFIYLLFDIVERRKHQEQLLLSASVFENTVEGIAITDHKNTIQKVNAAFTDITQFSAEEAIGKSIHILNPEGIDEDVHASMKKGLVEDGVWSGEVWNRRKSGEFFPTWVSVSAIKNLKGGITHFVSLFHDITDLKQTQDHLKHQAYHDALTGLPNRQLLHDRLEMAIAHAQRHQEKIAVIFIDLDNFKNINDCYGHAMGDIFLKEVASRLKQSCREIDTVARLGGDEFTIILPDIIGYEYVTSVINRIMESLKKAMRVDGSELLTSASFGITLYPHDGETVESLVKNADMAMYRAKQKGKGTYIYYTEAITSAVLHRIDLETGLRKAINEEEFVLHYQPVVNTSTGHISGCEALIRWQRKTGELIPPDEFIPLAEETDLVYSIGDWVITTACKQLKLWQDAGFTDLSIAINLSSRNFQQKGLANKIKEVLDKNHLRPDALHIELTEMTFMEHTTAVKKNMQQLHDLGVVMALDDFGTGYSALNYLQHFPLDIIKIDRTFIRDLVHNERDQAVARAILNLCHDLGMSVIAEGVENQEQLEFIKKHKCLEYQGFLFSKPLPADVFYDLLCEKKRPRTKSTGYP